MQTTRSLIDHPVSRKTAAQHAIWSSGQLAYTHDALVSMALQIWEIQGCDDQMRRALDGDLDMQRGLLHLHARMEGLLEQLDDLIEATERLMRPGLHLHHRHDIEREQSLDTLQE